MWWLFVGPMIQLFKTGLGFLADWNREAFLMGIEEMGQDLNLPVKVFRVGWTVLSESKMSLGGLALALQGVFAIDPPGVAVVVQGQGEGSPLVGKEWFEKHRDVLAGDVDSLAAFHTEESILRPQEFQNSVIGSTELSDCFPLRFCRWWLQYQVIFWSCDVSLPPCLNEVFLNLPDLAETDLTFIFNLAAIHHSQINSIIDHAPGKLAFEPGYTFGPGIPFGIFLEFFPRGFVIGIGVLIVIGSILIVAITTGFFILRDFLLDDADADDEDEDSDDEEEEEEEEDEGY